MTYEKSKRSRIRLTKVNSMRITSGSASPKEKENIELISEIQELVSLSPVIVQRISTYRIPGNDEFEVTVYDDYVAGGNQSKHRFTARHSVMSGETDSAVINASVAMTYAGTPMSVSTQKCTGRVAA